MKQRIALLNLPNAQRITRRYMCTYVSPISLFPPLELLSSAAVIKQFGDNEVCLIDSIADQLTTAQTIARLSDFKPDYVITLIGFECFEDDMAVVAAVKQALPQTGIIAFGHYPTLFFTEILNASSIDYIIKGEPEEVIADWLASGVAASAFHHPLWKAKQVSFTDIPTPRIRDIKQLPAPAYELMKADSYFEPFMARPFAMVQTARGCPYKCNYCVKSYGTRLSLRSPEQVVEELEMLVELHKIRSFRFIDDTFTVNPHRVKDICKLMAERKLKLSWTCLSRTDNIKTDMLEHMKAAGCERIYFGLESGSQRMLDLYEKEINADEALVALKNTRRAGIETTGFFILGLPDETENDFAQTLSFALNADLSLVSVGGITLYPGTALYDRYKHLVEFSLFPYVNRFKDIEIEKRYLRWEKIFYSKFYQRPTYLTKLALTYIQKPHAVWQTVNDAVSYQLSGYSFMPGIKRQKMVVDKA